MDHIATELAVQGGIVCEEMSNDDIMKRPTKFSLNEFTWAFQQLTNTYGIPTYQEVNPAYLSIVTFPFLFGVIFGDIMHGSILFIFASYLCIFKFKPDTTIHTYLYPARYLFLLMGLFSVFNGLIYNEYASFTTNIFGQSCYSLQKTAVKGNTFLAERETSPVTHEQECVYPFGIDPIWYRSTQTITFMNSLKMKIAVILGVSQMTIGIVIKGMNALFFKRWSEFVFEFLTQLITLSCLFGFMDYLIIAKWTTNWEGKQPPGIISSMIADATGKDSDHVILNQKTTFNLLLNTVFVCVPLMLLVIPVIKNVQNSKKASIEESDGYQNAEDAIVKNEMQENKLLDLLKGLRDEKPARVETMFELLINQLIITIEFVLGTISNTASYLRLWALSLAHSCLADVFFGLTLEKAILSKNYYMMFVSFYIYMGCTFGVLMCMDLLEGFLHTLRLHWVEFQSKFFHGDGYLFQPFSFVDEFQKAGEMINDETL